jgi:hypothetical protein
LLLIKSLDDRPNHNGVLAWQRLLKDAEGLEETLKEKLVEKVQYPDKIYKMEDVQVAMERWEHQVRRLQDRFGEKISGSSKVSILKRMLPDALEDRIANLGLGTKTYEEIVRYVDSQVSYYKDKEDQASRKTPVKISDERFDETALPEEELNTMKGFGKGKGGKNGGGKGKGFECWHCGGAHKRAECTQFTQIMDQRRSQ